MEKAINVNNIRYSYIDEGHGEVCLLIHGMRDSKTIWEEVVDYLKTKFRVIAIDLRGHGASSKHGIDYSLELFFSDLLGFTEALGLEKINFIGHSFGAAASLWMALNCPRKVSRTILIGCGKCTAEDTERRKEFFRPPDGSIDPSTIQRLVRDKFFPRNRKTVSNETIDAIKDRIVSGWDVYHEPQNRMVHENLVRLDRPVFDACFDRIDIPTLMIFGELDEVSPVENGKYLGSKIPNSKLVVMGDCGHYMLLEQTNKFCDIVVDFLEN